MAEQKEVICKSCGKEFTVDSYSETVFCVFCGAKMILSPTPSAPEEISEKKKGQAISQCPKCNAKASETNVVHTCSVCNAIFCDTCPEPHIPPEQNQISAKLLYKYRIRPSTIWNADAHTIADSLPSPLCNVCYGSEFEHSISRMKIKIRNWKVEALREMDIKDVEEIMPKRKEDEKKKVVESAQELLKMIGRV